VAVPVSCTGRVMTARSRSTVAHVTQNASAVLDLRQMSA